MRVRQIQQRISLAGRYASALTTEAKTAHQMQTLTRDITQFKELLLNHQELATALKGQLLRPKIATAIFADLAKIINFSEIFLKFLSVVADNRRLKFLPEIFETFLAIVDDQSNIVPVKIEVVKINQEDKVAIEKLLVNTLPSQSLKYSYCEVPELLGGFRAFINEQCLDYSLISRLNRLRYQLKEA